MVINEQIQHMQRLQLAGQLAGGIAHELNNQLTLILGNLELALDQLPAGDNACESLEGARSAAGRCADMSRQLVTVSRQRRADKTKMDFAAAVIEARKLLEYIRPPKVRVTTETEIGLLMNGNEMQIRHALLELGINAFHAMEQGGELLFHAYRAEDSVCLAAQDNGCGMTPSAQRRIFESLYASGLSTVQSIIAEHDGFFGLETRVGEGAIFLMSFPAADYPATSLR